MAKTKTRNGSATNGRISAKTLADAIAESATTEAGSGDEATVVTRQPIVITAPSYVIYNFTVVGLTPYMQNAWSHKAIEQMKDAQRQGDKLKVGKKNRPPKDFDAAFRAAFHRSTEGWVGVPTDSFKAALVAACRAAGLVMTQMKQAILNVEADGLDVVTGQGLVRLVEGGKPERNELPVRPQRGSTDIHPRPLWRKWGIKSLRIQVDAAMIDLTSLANLLMRAGQQVGIGEGRPGSPNSTGLGFGRFIVKPQ